MVVSKDHGSLSLCVSLFLEFFFFFLILTGADSTRDWSRCTDILKGTGTMYVKLPQACVCLRDVGGVCVLVLDVGVRRTRGE